MNSCEHVKKVLVDHGLAAIHRDDALAAHLQDCPTCQQLLEAWSQIPDLLDQASGEGTPARLEAFQEKSRGRALAAMRDYLS